MRKRKEKNVQTQPADTAITKVVARTVNDMTAAAAIARLKPAARNNSPVSHELTIRIAPAAGDDEEPRITAQLNRASIELPDELQKALRKYAVKVLAKGDAAE